MNQENQKEYMGKISGILLFFGMFLLVASCGERKGEDTNSEVPKMRSWVRGYWFMVKQEHRIPLQ